MGVFILKFQGNPWRVLIWGNGVQNETYSGDQGDRAGWQILEGVGRPSQQRRSSVRSQERPHLHAQATATCHRPTDTHRELSTWEHPGHAPQSSRAALNIQTDWPHSRTLGLARTHDLRT